MKKIVSILLLTIMAEMVLVGCLSPAKVSDKSILPVFLPGENGYAGYRIPSLLSVGEGKLIAFAEARKAGLSDTGNIDIVAKISDDFGKSWSKLFIVWDDGDNTCGNPCPVYIRDENKILMVMTWNKGSDHEFEIINKTSDDTRRVFTCESPDGGRSWSKPLEITSSVKKSEWGWYATGPGTGLIVRKGVNKGRIIIPCDSSRNGDYYSHFIYSDDNGGSWNIGAEAGPGCNECQAVELDNGEIVLNMRRAAPNNQPVRLFAVSKDCGESFQAGDSGVICFSDDRGPRCQAGFVRGENGVIVFSNPDSLKRKNMVVKISDNSDLKWEKTYKIFAGPAAYSSPAVDFSGKIGLLFEAGGLSPYEGIWFTEIPPALSYEN